MARAFISKNSHAGKTNNEEKKSNDYDDFCKKSAKERELRRQLEIEQRRGPTFFSNPFIPFVKVNYSGKIKSLKESCQFSLDDHDDER